MASEKNSANAKKPEKQKKLLLRKIFHTTWETREERVPDKLRMPDGKIVPYTPKYTATLSGAWKAYKDNTKAMLISSIYFALFLVPLLVLIFYGLPQMLGIAIGSSFNFMGNLGVGYPGVVDSISQAIVARLGVYQYFFIFVFAGAVVASIGMAGLATVAKKVMFNEKVETVSKKKSKDGKAHSVAEVFFKGVWQHGWKYLLAVTLGGAILLAMVSALVFQLKCSALGTSGPASICAVVFTWLFGAPLLMIPYATMTIIPSYKMNFVRTLSTALVLSVNKFPKYFIVGALSFVPFGIMFVSSMLSYILIAVVIVFGFSLIAMMWTGLGQSSYISCAAKFQEIEEVERIENATKARQERYQAQKEANKQNKPTGNKTNNKQQYQNPKKKKKK